MAQIGLITPGALEAADATAAAALLDEICDAQDKNECVDVEVNVPGTGINSGKLLPNGRFAYIA